MAASTGQPGQRGGEGSLGRIREAFTLRALAVGTVMCLVIGLGCPYNLHKVHGSYMAIDFSTAAAIFLFFVLVFMLNGVLRWCGLALNAGELLVVYVMMIVATSIPTMDGAAASGTNFSKRSGKRSLRQRCCGRSGQAAKWPVTSRTTAVSRCLNPPFSGC